MSQPATVTSIDAKSNSQDRLAACRRAVVRAADWIADHEDWGKRLVERAAAAARDVQDTLGEGRS